MVEGGGTIGPAFVSGVESGVAAGGWGAAGAALSGLEGGTGPMITLGSVEVPGAGTMLSGAGELVVLGESAGLEEVEAEASAGAEVGAGEASAVGAGADVGAGALGAGAAG